MSSEHVNTKRKIKLQRKSDFINLLNDLMLSKQEREVMELFYIERKSMLEIADDLGYSEIGVKKIHQRVIKKIAKYI